MRAVWIGLGCLILLTPAFLNHGPFINYDSEQYFMIGRSIVSAAGELINTADPTAATAPQVLQAGSTVAPGTPPPGMWVASYAGARSPFYSLFLYLAASQAGLWTVAILQALATAWLLSLAANEFGRGFRPLPYLSVVTALTLFSSIGFFVAWPMPDVFAGLFVLAALVFLLGSRANRVERVMLWGLMALSASFHTTIVLLAPAIAVVAAAVMGWSGRRPAAALGAAALAALTVVPGLAGSQVYERVSEGAAGFDIYSPPFLTARLIGDGTGQRFLGEVCPTGRYDFAVCQFSGRTFADNNQFLWGTEQGPSAYQTSAISFQKRLSAEDFAFVQAVVSEYPAAQIAASTGNVLRQVRTVTFDDDHRPLRQIVDNWPNALILKTAPQYERCLTDPESCGRPPFITPWQWLISIGFHTCLVLCLGHAVLSLRRPMTEDDRKLLTWTLVLIPMLLINATICGVLSGVSVRYQARLAWVLPALSLAAAPVIWARLSKAKAA